MLIILSKLLSCSCLLKELRKYANHDQKIREMVLQENQLIEGGVEDMTSSGMTQI